MKNTVVTVTEKAILDLNLINLNTPELFGKSKVY